MTKYVPDSSNSTIRNLVNVPVEDVVSMYYDSQDENNPLHLYSEDIFNLIGVIVLEEAKKAFNASRAVNSLYDEQKIEQKDDIISIACLRIVSDIKNRKYYYDRTPFNIYVKRRISNAVQCTLNEITNVSEAEGRLQKKIRTIEAEHTIKTGIPPTEDELINLFAKSENIKVSTAKKHVHLHTRQLRKPINDLFSPVDINVSSDLGLSKNSYENFLFTNSLYNKSAEEEVLFNEDESALERFLKCYEGILDSADLILFFNIIVIYSATDSGRKLTVAEKAKNKDVINLIKRYNTMPKRRKTFTILKENGTEFVSHRSLGDYLKYIEKKLNCPAGEEFYSIRA